MLRKLRWFLILMLAWNDGVLLWKSGMIKLSTIANGDAIMKSPGERWQRMKVRGDD